MKFAAVVGEKIVNTVDLDETQIGNPEYIERQMLFANKGQPCDLLRSLDGVDPEPGIGDLYTSDHQFVYIDRTPVDEEPQPPHPTEPDNG